MSSYLYTQRHLSDKKRYRIHAYFFGDGCLPSDGKVC